MGSRFKGLGFGVEELGLGIRVGVKELGLGIRFGGLGSRRFGIGVVAVHGV